MPLFEFRCTECGSEFEKLIRKAGKYDGIVCPVCRSGKVDEMLSMFSSLAGDGSSSSPKGRCKPAGG